MVLSLRLDGHAQDEAKGSLLMFKVNGEMAPKGANQITPKDGDKLEFTKKSISTS